MAADPMLVELDGGVATFDNGATLTFPPGCVFTPEPMGDKQAQRITPPKIDGRQGPSFVLIKGASWRTVENAIRRIPLGV